MTKHEEPCRYDEFMADIPSTEIQEKIYAHLNNHLIFSTLMQSRAQKALHQITIDNNSITGEVEQ